MTDSSPATAARHWHLIGRHVHPEWHGHCDPAKRGYKRCDRPHWHIQQDSGNFASDPQPVAHAT